MFLLSLPPIVNKELGCRFRDRHGFSFSPMKYKNKKKILHNEVNIALSLGGVGICGINGCKKHYLLANNSHSSKKTMILMKNL